MGRDGDYVRLINSGRWRRLRAEVLTREPTCRDCMEAGRIVPATEVHHDTPVETGADYARKESLCYDPANLVPLCHECHRLRHRRMGKRSREETRRRADARARAFMERYWGDPGGGFLKTPGGR